MLITKKITETVEREEVVGIICNKCGGSCYNYPNDPHSYEGVQVSKSGGYWSKYLGDMCQYQFDLCEKCLWEFMQSFKHDAYVKEEDCI
jgi:hypothetical protein